MLLRAVAALMLLSIQASSQGVISTHSGLVDYFEGDVYPHGSIIPAIKGRYLEIRENGLLTTNIGQVEVLLNPDVFLWLGPDAAIRMERNTLNDTRVELVQGSAVIQADQLSPENAVTLLRGSSQIRVSAQSLYASIL
jgi:hypothetical protein